MNCLSRREFTKRAAGGVAAAFSSVVPVDGLTTAKRAAGGTEKIDLAILMLPEVLPPWEHFDYDVREQYLHSGASNLTYVVRHLENLCHNLGLSVRRAQIDGLGNLHNMVLLVPDASRMLPETRAALDKWIIQDKPVIVFGEVPQKWAIQYGIEVVGARKSSYKPQGHSTIYFPSGDLSIAGAPSNYATYIAGEPIALVMDSGNTKVRFTLACQRGSLLLCGWSPRLHFWEVIAEQDELRFFARLLKEVQIDVAVPELSAERIRDLKSLGVSDWGLWMEKDLTPADSMLAGYGFDHIYQYDSYFSRIFDRKFEEALLGVPLTLQLKSESSSNQLGYLQNLITTAHNSKLKVYVVINPFSLSYSPCLYNELLQRDGLQYRHTDGVLHPTDYWSPANPELTRLAIESLREFLAQQNVDGIFIDFARYLDGNFDYGPAMRTLFERQIATRIKAWPKSVIDDPDLAPRYAGFKRHVMNRFLGQFGRTAKEMQKQIVVEALYYWNFWPDPGGAYEAIGQDPEPLVNMGALDRACGMFYTSDNAQLEVLVDQAIKDVGRVAFGCILAPMSYFNEYTTTHQIFDQIQILKNKNVSHASIFSHVPDHLLYNRFENGERINQ